MQDADLLRSAVHDAGELALRYFRNDPKRWIKKDGSVLTEADLAVNDLLQDRLRKTRPAYAWLSEEGPDDNDRGAAKHTWLLDPIDGTRSFADGRDEWGVACALIEDGKPVLSAIYQPSTRLMYFAVKGGGATCNGNPIRVSDGESLEGARLAGRSSALKRFSNFGVIATDMSKTPQLLRLCLLAEGSVDIVATFGLKHDWDIAAGALLVEEGGGKVTDENGAEMTFNHSHPNQQGMIAAGEQRHIAVFKHLEQKWPTNN